CWDLGAHIGELVGRQLDLELGRCSVSAAAYKVGVRFGPGIKSGRQNEASSKFDGSRCFQHDNRSLHLLHSTLSYRLETSTRRQCVACNALKPDKRGEEIAKCLNHQSELIASVLASLWASRKTDARCRWLPASRAARTVVDPQHCLRRKPSGRNGDNTKRNVVRSPK